jgi:hypothetical protein
MPAKQSTEVTTFSALEESWGTPEWIVETCRTVMSGIDLDPASSPFYNETVRATEYFTQEDNGLAHPWFGYIFLNPPSNRTNPTARVVLWVDKLVSEYRAGHVKQACLVVKSNLGYVWYEQLYSTFWVCHLTRRPAFILPDGTDKGPAKKGVSVFYLGHRVHWFAEVFHQYGRVIPPAQWIRDHA